MNPIENLKTLIVYQSQNNDNISVEVLYDNEDFWLIQKSSLSKLLDVEVNTIYYHWNTWIRRKSNYSKNSNSSERRKQNYFIWKSRSEIKSKYKRWNSMD